MKARRSWRLYYETDNSSKASLCVTFARVVVVPWDVPFVPREPWELAGNLTCGEILEQIVHADRILADEWISVKENNNNNNNPSSSSLKLDLVRNVVFMGMGEPLDNYKNVVEACRALIDNKRWSE